jgi:S1-C subfamily serine protease
MTSTLVRLPAVLAGAGFLLAACTTTNGGTSGPANFRNTLDERVQAVPVAQQQVAPAITVVLPDRDRLRPLVREVLTRADKTPTGTEIEAGITAFQEILTSEIDGLRRSNLFGAVQQVTLNDTTEPKVAGADYILWFQVRTTGPNFTGRWIGDWRMRRGEGKAQVRIVADPGVAERERIAAWVRSTEAGARRLGEGKGDQDPAPAGGSATAFAISSAGHLLTNNHAVDGCSELSVRLSDGRNVAASILAHDRENDLALLKVEEKFATWARVRNDPVRQGENVVAVGYPLSTLLSNDAVVTTGNVSALSGLRNDLRYFQFTAPVQQGNSGGPLLDSAGNLAGVVTAKLNALNIAFATGDLPQNVNFAVKGSLVREFTAGHGVNTDTAPAAAALNTVDIFTKARAFTMRLECTAERKPAPATATASATPAPAAAVRPSPFNGRYKATVNLSNGDRVELAIQIEGRRLYAFGQGANSHGRGVSNCQIDARLSEDGMVEKASLSCGNADTTFAIRMEKDGRGGSLVGARGETYRITRL